MTRMKDALGGIGSLLVLGGTSEIGLAVARLLVRRGCSTVVLASRDPGGQAGAVQALLAEGADRVECVAYDADDVHGHTAFASRTAGLVDDLDVVLVAVGVLGDQAAFELDPVAAARAVTTNYTGLVSTCLAFAPVLRAQGHGTLVLLSSVAGVRARRSNFVYGSSKAGLDAFGQGLGDALAGSGARVMLVRPGFVHTRMTKGLPAAPFSTSPDVVAAAIVDALARDADVVWVPAVLRLVFAGLRVLPRGLWRRLPG